MNPFKDRINRPFIPTVIVDNFFESPSLWRHFALSQEFYKGERGTWPGIRTAMLKDLSTELYEILEFKLLQQLPQFKRFSKIESTFQLIVLVNFCQKLMLVAREFFTVRGEFLEVSVLRTHQYNALINTSFINNVMSHSIRS